MSQTGYKAELKEKIVFGGRDITKKDIIRVKTHPSPVLTQDVDAEKVITPVLIITLHVTNPLTEEGEKEYTEYRILDKDGSVYLTSSESLYNSIISISDELVDDETGVFEEFGFKIVRIKSNTQQGHFYLAEIV